MSYKLFVVIIALVIGVESLLNAQSLYMPVDIAKAYNKQTRNLNGNPGPKYWINSSDYKINVEVNPLENKLSGEETITYQNNSPDDLDRIVVRIYMDFYKQGSRRNIQISPNATTSGVDIQKIIVSGNELDVNSNNVKRNGTNLTIYLLDPLKPGNKIDLGFKWAYKIPETNKIRMGVYDSSSYFISLWYPQIAVYDDINGWDSLSYTGLQEFYNDYSNFEVNIKTPKEFVVWATGNQTNTYETLNEKYLDRINKALMSDKVVNVITEKDRTIEDITKNEFNIWKFKANNVPDFAFSLSNKYLWDLKSVVVDDKNNQKVLISTAYNKDSKDFYEVAEIASQSVKLMSAHLPGIPFPYDNVTIFNSDGNSGMEFPMIINDGSFLNRSRTTGITAHELLHQYFPFYVGTNERKYAWMDEGWARMMQFDIQETIEPSLNKEATVVEKYSKIGGSEYDVPLMIPSSLFDSYLPYKTHAYTRPSMALIALIKYRGLDLFKKALHEYIYRWKGKHPIPYDFFFTFNEIYKEDLEWFWNPWFFEFGFPDLGIKEVIKQGEESIVIVERVGNFPLPIELKVIYDSGAEKIFYEKTGVWKSDIKLFEINIGSKKNIEKIELGSNEIPDVNENNNFYFFGNE